MSARHAWLAACALLLAGCVRVLVHDPDATAVADPGPERPLRVATYNVSLYADTAGGALARLQAGDANVRKVAAVLQRVRPDVVLLNEVDFDASGAVADALQRDYLEVPQRGGGAPLRYPYRYLAPVNTGVPSGLDLDRSGAVGGEGRDRGNDAWGYGLHPGQYGMLLLSMHPIDAAGVRTFQYLRWSTMPGALRPADPATGAHWYDDATWPQLRLSSKSHWDVPVRTPAGVVHVLASHPTPPVFDGPEDRNGTRNHDEIRLWSEYLDDTTASARWLCDDAGRCGGLAAGARFVVLGDLNNDPDDGDGRHDAIRALLAHPRMAPHPVPRSAGAAAVAAAGRHQRGPVDVVPAPDGAAAAGTATAPPRRGDASHATGDFGRAGALRLDYVLPSQGFRVRAGGVYWPAPGEDGADLVDGSDHRLVWLDLES